MHDTMKRLVELDRERSLLSHIGALLGWDQETFMPEKAIDERAEQLALIEGLAHAKAVDPAIGEALSSLESTDGLDPTEQAYLRVARREYDKETKLPAELVVELARETSLSQAAWVKARKDSDFSQFAPHLETMIRLNKQVAACLDPHSPPYDVLLDQYEFGSTEASVAAVFSAMKADLVRILGKITAKPQIDDGFLRRGVGKENQARMSEYFMDVLEFDRKRGRLDIAAHPFTTTVGRDDVRITTRYEEEYFPSSIFSTIHESGHAFYELGIDPDARFVGTRLSEAASMAIHESQSRTWENIIGRSAGFWKRHYDHIKTMAGGSLDSISASRFVKAINKVEASLIRTEADEVTYGLHVIARFELEAELISGRLAVPDVPAAWNAKIKDLLGLDVPNDAVGCLQDIHWSMGAFGYFPSYALGNLYSAQFWAQMEKDIPGLYSDIEKADFKAIHAWLKRNIHADGARYLPGELVLKVTGHPLDPSHFARYLEKKYSEVYGF